MQSLSINEMKSMADDEIQTACKKIENDLSRGVFGDVRDPLDNVRLLVKEMEQREVVYVGRP